MSDLDDFEKAARAVLEHGRITALDDPPTHEWIEQADRALRMVEELRLTREQATLSAAVITDYANLTPPSSSALKRIGEIQNQLDALRLTYWMTIADKIG